MSTPSRPLHPPLVHVPIGGVVIASVCDLVSTVGGTDHAWAHTWFKSGSYALIVGTAVLFLAAVAGAIDRVRRTDAGTSDRRAVNAHAVLMLLVGAVSVTDLLLRNNHYADAGHTPALVLALTPVALVLLTAGGELGGRLVHGRGIGTRHAERIAVTDADRIHAGDAGQ